MFYRTQINSWIREIVWRCYHGDVAGDVVCNYVGEAKLCSNVQAAQACKERGRGDEGEGGGMRERGRGDEGEREGDEGEGGGMREREGG